MKEFTKKELHFYDDDYDKFTELEIIEIENFLKKDIINIKTKQKMLDVFNVKNTKDALKILKQCDDLEIEIICWFERVIISENADKEKIKRILEKSE